ncbi:hypothetical protein [Streptomyces sp. NBRC 109706]|uniref:hypothetical protein n=1 Tax=Streptomyces sp. NBRC 109706 TaxID=1550035 RepID=UPI000AB3F662|nr:hypothetical protein [Streptomyces sp. NBRC 109706]
MSEPTRTTITYDPDPHPTMRDLHRVMGELLDLLPDMGDPTGVSWDVGRQPDGTVGLRVSAVGPDGPELLEAAHRLMGGDVRPSGDVLVHVGGGRSRMTALHTEHVGVPVRVTAWLPEPDEREALLARLAELDAAEGPQGGGDGE